MTAKGETGKQAATVFLFGRDAELAKVVAHFPDDLAVALQSVARIRAAAAPLADVTTEPWPPMQTRSVK